jgi:hypothetical protein
MAVKLVLDEALVVLLHSYHAAPCISFYFKSDYYYGKVVVCRFLMNLQHRIPLNTRVNSCAPEGSAVPVLLVTPVVLLLSDMKIM